MSNTFHDITILLDSSGSMQSIKEATLRGINDFIKKVNSEPGDGCWTLLQFDDQNSAVGASEKFPHTVFEAVENKNVPLIEPSQYNPRGGTALVDAICLTINSTRQRIAARYDSAQNVKVLIVIMTDGQENSSVLYSTAQMRALIALVQREHFEFMFLGANQEAFTVTGSYGLAGTPHYLQNAVLRGTSLIGAEQVASNQLGNNINFDASDAGVGACLTSGAVCAALWKSDGAPISEEIASGRIDPTHVSITSNS